MKIDDEVWWFEAESGQDYFIPFRAREIVLRHAILIKGYWGKPSFPEQWTEEATEQNCYKSKEEALNDLKIRIEEMRNE